MTELTQDPVSEQDDTHLEDSSQGTPEAASPESSQPDADNTAADPQPNQPPANTQRADPKSSLPNSIPVASNTHSQEEKIDPEGYKRLRDSHSQLGREAATIRKQLEEQRLQITTFQQDREKQAQFAKQQKLALHDYRHPEHATKFVPLQAKADIVRTQLSNLAKTRTPEGLTPEQGQAWREASEQALLSTLSEEEQNALAQFQQHKQNFDRRWATNPDEVLTERVIPMIREEMQRAMRETQAASDVDKDFNDPELGPVIKEMGAEMDQAIKSLGGTDEAYEFVKQQALVYAHNRKANEHLAQENARLKQQLQEAGLKIGTAKVQQNLAKGRASVTRDVSTKQTKPAYEQAAEWASKNSVDRTSVLFHQKLREFQNESR